MTGLTALVRRVPRVWLFAAAGVIQVGLVALMVIDRMQVLRDGAEVTLQTQPVDPRDFLRGDYVVLSYDISSPPAAAVHGLAVPTRRPFVFVKLARKPDGIYQAVSTHLQEPSLGPDEKLIRGRVTSGAYCGERPRIALCGTIQVAYGIESYFVPEGEGLAIEEARNKQRVTVVAAVTPAGRAAIKRLLIDGKPLYDEPLF